MLFVYEKFSYEHFVIRNYCSFEESINDSSILYYRLYRFCQGDLKLFMSTHTVRNSLTELLMKTDAFSIANFFGKYFLFLLTKKPLAAW